MPVRRERGASLALGAGAGSAGETSSSCGVRSRASRASMASLTLSRSAGVRMFAFGHARSVQASRSSLGLTLPARKPGGPEGLPRLGPIVRRL